MNINKITEILEKAKIPLGAYSLDGIRHGECLCMYKENGEYHIVYNSRGDLVNVGIFKNETEACNVFLNEMSKIYPNKF